MGARAGRLQRRGSGGQVERQAGACPGLGIRRRAGHVQAARKAGEAVQAPDAFFYLPEPPVEDEPQLADFREKPPGRLTPGLIYQVRHAQERREIALDLYNEINEKPPRYAFFCARDQPATDVGARLREMLGVQLKQQREWSKDAAGYAALSGWKDAAERSGVMIFQAPRTDMSGARGFSIHQASLPIIALASEDVPVARVFTLMHELAHLGLRKGGICDLHDQDLELFCNKAAAAALMPSSALLAEVSSIGQQDPDNWSDHALRSLARTFSVSEQALVLRLVELGAASWDFYRKKRAEFDLRARQAKARTDEGGKGGVPQHQVSMARNGMRFTSLVLEAYHRQLITAHRATSYLGVSYDGLGKIEHEVQRRLMRAS